MLAAVIPCDLGFVAGGRRFARRSVEWQVPIWAVLVTLSVMLPLALADKLDGLAKIGGAPIIVLFYAGMFCLLIGFIFWYRSLVQKGPASIGPLKFLQSLLRSTSAATVLCEPIEWTLLPVIGCAAVGRIFA